MLSENPIFQGTTTEWREALLSRSQVKRYQSGESVIRAGHLADSVYVLERGSVRVFQRSSDGRELVIRFLFAPAIFGDAETLSGLPYLDNVDAYRACEVVVVPGEVIRSALSESPLVALALVRDLSMRLSLSSQKQRSLAFDSVEVRLANQLLELLSRAGSTGFLRVTQDGLARSLGVGRRSVGKCIVAWKRAGILDRDGTGYRVCEIEKLKHRADPQHQ